MRVTLLYDSYIHYLRTSALSTLCDFCHQNIYLEPRYVVRSECSSTTLFVRQAGSTAHPVILVPQSESSGNDKDSSASEGAPGSESGSFEGAAL